jgi:pyruvate, orthophosphate dikinase
MAPPKYVYDFAEGSRAMRELLGGKGANVAEMTRVLGPELVPAGFTITTEACVAYMRAAKELPAGCQEQIDAALERLQGTAGRRLGAPEDPLLVSVRSGARESMPGMLDTVLNLGLNDQSVLGLARATDNEWFAWDSYRRFVQMFANVVRGIGGDLLEAEIAEVKRARGVRLDTELEVDDLRTLVDRFQAVIAVRSPEPFPQDPAAQLASAIRAVFDSWEGERAVEYRRLNHIPDDWGTAVNVQQMVFGNKGETSGSGVAFSRDEITGAPEPSGDFLVNAQGEDVVSGTRNTQDLADLARVMPDVHAQLIAILHKLEAHYQDMQDTEFTIEETRLFMLQTRSAKRPAQAALRFACDAVDEGLLTEGEALNTIDAAGIEVLLHPTFDRAVDYTVIARGVAASPGAGQGEVVFTAHDAVVAGAEGRDVVLVRPFTEADDVAGFHAARGILTSEGGKASHAALVARGMGKPAVVGAAGLEVDLAAKEIRLENGTVIREGDHIAIDGTTGAITTDHVPVVVPEIGESFRRVLAWADAHRQLEVRANADTPGDAVRAREFGAQGIGLCRTEHMFMAEDRVPKMQAMILADTVEHRRTALAQLLPLQQADFEGLFEAMAGLPVTIRLLDPPLHEFLPSPVQLTVDLERARTSGDAAETARLEALLDRTSSLQEVNPMLGTRGCRLGIIFPEIYEMQVRAIARAAQAVRRRIGTAPKLEVMVPLVDYERELEIVRELIDRVAAEEDLLDGRDYTVGTMIELPRACLVADRIAHHADFFSFGTNDLTQTGLGFSRDDIEARILRGYMDYGILDRSPFETIDSPGVGQLLRMGGWLGRKANPELELGICGEHGGDPDSIAFFHDAWLDYVSCSPYRVPVARIAAAQAAIRSPVRRIDGSNATNASRPSGASSPSGAPTHSSA